MPEVISKLPLDQFAESYTDAMADAAQRLRLLRRLLDRTGVDLGQGATSSLTCDCFSVVSQVCRIVAETTSCEFGKGEYVPVPPRPVSAAAAASAFEGSTRQLMPVRIIRFEGSEVIWKPSPSNMLLPADLQSMLDTAEMLFTDPEISRRRPQQQRKLSELAATMHVRLHEFLEAHIVSLPEWSVHAISRFPKEGPGAHWGILTEEHVFSV